MTPPTSPRDLARKARLAGLLCLVTIMTDLGAELGLRGPLNDLGDAAAILAGPGQFRPANAADLVMALSAAGLAILLHLIFRARAPGLALSSMVVRLIQTVLAAASLMALPTAWPAPTRAEGLADAPALALVFLDLHAHSLDLKLAIAGLVCLRGGGLRLFAPEGSPVFAPANGLTSPAQTSAAPATMACPFRHG